MRNSPIAWCHHTHNPWEGCSGERCPLFSLALCYAKFRIEHRFHRDFATARLTTANNWQNPWKWEREAVVLNQAYRVFCGSMMDINDRQADEWRTLLWPMIKGTPHLVWLLLSKIPERYVETLPDDWGSTGYENVWLGASTLNSEDLRRNAKALRAVPAAKRFLSMEPLMSKITNPDFTGIDQILVGGMSGVKWQQHKMEMDWAVSLYYEAVAQGVLYFFKQVSAYKDEQGIDAIGVAIDGHPRIIREVPDYKYPWVPMKQKGDLTK